jgi:hypothetical protein
LRPRVAVKNPNTPGAAAAASASTSAPVAKPGWDKSPASELPMTTPTKL